jgi:hypothetical protein
VHRPRLEVADVFHRSGADWRRANAGHMSLGQLQVGDAQVELTPAEADDLRDRVERAIGSGHATVELS